MEFLRIEPILMGEIEALALELQTIKDKMYDLCENDKTEVQVRDIPRDTDDNIGPQKRKRYVNLRWEVLWFFEMIMKVRTNKKQSTIAICIRTPTNDTYGFQFDLNSDGMYSMIRCRLPVSLQEHEELHKAKNVYVSELKTYVSEFQTNVYALSKRKEQFDAFESVYEKHKVKFDCSLNYTKILLRSYVNFRQTRHCVELECLYKLNEILPGKVHQNIQPNIHTRYKDAVLAEFQVFEHLQFQHAYEQAFLKSTLFTY